MTLTIDIDDQTLARARRYAQRFGAPLEEIVQGHLRELAIKGMTRHELAQEFTRFCDANARKPATGWKWNREDLYEERL